MITEINKSKSLPKYLSCKYKCKKWNNDKSRCECEKPHQWEKSYIRNPPACSCENGKYLASATNDLLITCDEIIKEKNYFNKF